MHWYPKKSYRVLSVALAAVTGIIALGIASGSSAFASASGTGATQIAADVACDVNHPINVPFYYSNGARNFDLMVCTNSQWTETSITNTTQGRIWHINQPAFSYWTLKEDIEQNFTQKLSGATLLYRTWMTANYPNAFPTIEPGFTATLPYSPNQIQLGHQAGEESAWQVASLMAYSMSSNGVDFIKILEDSTGPTGTAVIKCAQAAYNIGQTLYTQDPSQDIASQLQAGLGIYNHYGQCATAVDNAERKAQSLGETAPVTLREIQDATHTAEWQDTDDLVRGVANFIEADLKVAHDIHF